MTKQTPYGLLHQNEQNEVEIYATRVMLWDWANRSGARWPCSALALLDEITVEFDSRGDLVGLEGESEDLSSDELNAWSSDVLEAAGLGMHPANRNEVQ